LPRAPKFNATPAASLAPSPANLFVGTSGWAYPTWKPGFYPADVPSRAFLPFYASKLTSVEVNYTFRTLPTRTQLQGWLDATPPGFRFSFKAPQRITHFQRLRGSQDGSQAAVAEFIAALEPAREAGKLGALLFQLPPNFPVNLQRLKDFLASLEFSKGLQVAFEFRHLSWFIEDTYTLLKQQNAALCVAETDDLVTPDIQTASYRYYRLRRESTPFTTKPNTFAARFTKLAKEGEVYVYFKHEDEPTGALNALALLHRAASKARAR
jgi:uncharacterized protein YecE (DUF72 family)